MGVWHTYSTRQTLSELETDKSRGLSGAEAERRLARWGPNRLEEGRRQGLLLRFLGQMKDPMILVLLAAAALSLWASGGEDWLDAAIILVIVVVNACISISQEDSAEKALEALRKMSAPLAKVVRDGALQRLETDRLVPGDIIHLEAGDLVPADARILEAASLQADESAMTGESVPVSKGLLSALPEDPPWRSGTIWCSRPPSSPGGGRCAWSPAPAWTPRWAALPGCCWGRERDRPPSRRRWRRSPRPCPSSACACAR